MTSELLLVGAVLCAACVGFLLGCAERIQKQHKSEHDAFWLGFRQGRESMPKLVHSKKEVRS
jgi:hypothetical protein